MGRPEPLSRVPAPGEVGRDLSSVPMREAQMDQLTKHSVHEYEGVVDKLCGRHCAGVHHHLVRINPLTSRGNTSVGGGSRPHSETGRDQSGSDGSGKRCGLTHLSSPVQISSRRATCQTMPLAAVMAITKCSFGKRKTPPRLCRVRRGSGPFVRWERVQKTPPRQHAPEACSVTKPSAVGGCPQSLGRLAAG